MNHGRAVDHSGKMSAQYLQQNITNHYKRERIKEEKIEKKKYCATVCPHPEHYIQSYPPSPRTCLVE